MRAENGVSRASTPTYAQPPQPSTSAASDERDPISCPAEDVVLLLIYGLALLVAVLFSEWSKRTVLSSAALFVAVGFLVGPAGLALLDLDPAAPLVSRVSELALFTILFSDGLKLGLRDLRRAWRLPGRALLVGMPITLLLIAVAARLLFNLPWVQAFLIGAVLSPTDPVFASAIVGREEIPERLRHLLNVESGLNDGLALPAVLALLAISSHEPWDPWQLAGDAAGGLVLGGIVAAAAGWLSTLPLFKVARGQEPLLPLAVGIIVFASAQTLHANEYLAAFAAGVTLATLAPQAREEFRDAGERIGEVLKLAAVLLLIVMFSGLSSDVPLREYVFAVAVLTFARSAAIGVALIGSRLTAPERLVAAWFGPKGFASVVYGLMILRQDLPGRELLFEVVAVVIVLSILLHSSTDVPIAHFFERTQRAANA
jgi:NhaP-type Na+/H+ or K+/H+ antiporter